MVNKILIALASVFLIYGGYKSYVMYDATQQLIEEIAELDGFIQNKDDSIADYEAKIEELHKNIATEKSTLATLTAERKKLDETKSRLKATRYDALDEQIAENEQTLKDAEQKYNTLVDTEPLLEEIRDLEEEIAHLEEEIEDNENQLAYIRKYQGEEDHYIAVMTQRQENIKNRVSEPNLVAKVISVNPEWNQLTIDKGDTSGVVANTALYVVRGDETIADLEVTTLMPTYAILDITANLQDNVIQVGDKIVAVK